MSKIKLFCIPYAGGSAIIFNQWKQYVNSRIDVRPIELAGRGKRINDELYKDLANAIDDVFKIVRAEIGQSPYAFFGHSLGSRIVYGLAQKIRDHNMPAPQHIFFSGSAAPHVRRSNEKIFHKMSATEFKREILELGGTPPEFFEHPELMELFLPLLKNDFRIAEEKIWLQSIRPLDGSISVLLGKDDDLNDEECHGWRKHTQKICTLHYFNGGHFFLHSDTEELVKIINDTLNRSKHLELVSNEL